MSQNLHHHRAMLSIIVEGNELQDSDDNDVSDESTSNSPAVGNTNEHNKHGDDEHKTVRAWKVKRDSLTRRTS